MCSLNRMTYRAQSRNETRRETNHYDKRHVPYAHINGYTCTVASLCSLHVELNLTTTMHVHSYHTGYLLGLVS